MSDPTDPKPAFASAMNGFETASKSMRAFANEMQSMSKETMDQTSQMMEKLRGAKTIEEVVSLQTSFMQHSFTSYADYSRRFSELMMALPMELAKQSQTVFQQGADAIKKAAD